MANQYTTRGRREYQARLVEQWRSSGMTKKAFCETNDLAYYTFLRWTRRIAPSEETRKFVEIPAASATTPATGIFSPATVELDCAGVTLRVPVGIEEHELSRLLRAVENRRC